MCQLTAIVAIHHLHDWYMFNHLFNHLLDYMLNYILSNYLLARLTSCYMIESYLVMTYYGRTEELKHGKWKIIYCI